LSRWGICGVAGVLAVHVLAGCALESDSGSAEPSPTPTEAEPSATAEELALDAYESMWDVVVEASHEGETEPPELDTYAEDQALALMQHALSGAQEDGAEVTGEPEIAPEVVAASPSPQPDSVEIEDCIDDSQWLLDAESPSPEAEERRQVDATVAFDGLSWRVSEMRIWEHGTC
jgi:hypothetical protein